MNRISVSVVLTILLIVATCRACNCVETSKGRVPHSKLKQNVSPMMMNTNIALVGADPTTTAVRNHEHVAIDPTVLLNEAGFLNGNNEEVDIEEDPDDRFITTRSGKLRPRFVSGHEDWSKDANSIWRGS